MNRRDVDRFLRQWGLKDNEARVLAGCWQQGRGLYVHEIVTLTKFKRSTVDLVLQRLIERGLLIKLRAGQRYQYVAETPERLLEKQKQQMDMLSQILPLLHSWQQSGILPAVRVYEGIDGISDVYREILTASMVTPAAKRHFLAIDSGVDVYRLRPDFEKFFIRERVKRGIAVRIICPQDAVAIEGYRTNLKKIRECRYFPATPKDFAIALYIYVDRVALMSLRQPLQAVVIQHPVVTESLRTIFELLWQSLPA